MEETKKTSYERWPACKVRIKEVKDAAYIKVSEEYSPDYLTIGERKVSRANILAVVINIEKEDRFSSVTIDDGTDSIVVRDFDNVHNLERFNRGDVVRIIAKPREFNEQRYLILEIIMSQSLGTSCISCLTIILITNLINFIIIFHYFSGGVFFSFFIINSRIFY